MLGKLVRRAAPAGQLGTAAGHRSWALGTWLAWAPAGHRWARKTTGCNGSGMPSWRCSTRREKTPRPHLLLPWRSVAISWLRWMCGVRARAATADLRVPARPLQMASGVGWSCLHRASGMPKMSPSRGVARPDWLPQTGSLDDTILGASRPIHLFLPHAAQARPERRFCFLLVPTQTVGSVAFLGSARKPIIISQYCARPVPLCQSLVRTWGRPAARSRPKRVKRDLPPTHFA